MTTRSHTRFAFTLVEVLLVLVILSGIAAVLIPLLGGTEEKAKKDTTEVRIKRVIQKISIYKMNVGEYPTDDQGLQALVASPTFDDPTKQAKWAGPYLNTEYIKDEWGNALNYKLFDETVGETTRKVPRVWSNGPNGQNDEGEGDDIKSWTTEGAT